ncbi:MAG: hypothetical protein PVJ36_08155 [Nitrospirota bacterium]|jgi:hypothetical protein
MKRSIVTLILTAAALMGFVAAAHAEVEKSASADASVMSNYVWRGLKLSDSWVVQPSVSFGYGGFGANLWANYDGDTKEANETDLTLSYATSFDKVGLEVGYIYYALEGLNDTQELYASVSYDFVVSPSLTFYYDYDEGTGGYLVLAVDYGRDLSDKASLSVGASGSYLFDNNVVGVDATGAEYSDFHNGEIYASLDFAVTENVTISPMLAYSFPLSDDAEDMMKATSLAVSGDDDSDIVYGGVNVSVSF